VDQRRIVRCLGCGLYFQHPRPTLREAEEFYRGHYFQSESEIFHGYEDYSALAKPIRKLARRKLFFMGRTLAPADLLDVGAAYGLFLDEARKAGWRPEGVEISPEAAAVARRLTGLPVHVGALESLPLEPGRFDAVTCWDVIEHATDVKVFLRAVRSVMKPGGWLFITVPNAASGLAQLMGSRWFGFAKLEHIYYFSPGTLKRALETVGLRFLSWRPWPWACTVDYVARRLGYYSPLCARTARAVAAWMGIRDSQVDFPWIDILVVARRPNGEEDKDFLPNGDKKVE
jgi:2-polyprenyl-3-methyl-5-hydroxy-6-metoxy-1,4-benzoquinol methylase